MKTNRPVALITGVSRGIGKAIAIAISKEGYDIAGVSRTIGSSEKNIETKQNIAGQGDINDILPSESLQKND